MSLLRVFQDLSWFSWNAFIHQEFARVVVQGHWGSSSLLFDVSLEFPLEELCPTKEVQAVV